MRAYPTPVELRPDVQAPRLARRHEPRPAQFLPTWYRPADLNPFMFRKGKIRVGLDLDGVFYPFVAAFRHYLTAELGWNPAGLEAGDTWAFYRAWGISDAEFKVLCDAGVDAGVLFTWGDPLPGARQGAIELYNRGIELHIITARDFGTHPKGAEEATREWLNRHQIPYNSLTIAQTKTKVVTDYMVDDHLRNYDELEAAGTRVYLLDAPYNQDRPDDAPRRRVDCVECFAAEVIADARDQYGFWWNTRPPGPPVF